VLIFDAAVVAKCGHRFHVRCMHLWLTEGDADNEWNEMSTLARTTAPLLVYTIDLHDRLILHRGWPTGLNDVKEDFHRRFPHDTQKDDSYWHANAGWCKKYACGSLQATRDSDSGLPGYNFTYTMRKPTPYQSPEINHLFQDARERTTQAMIDYLVQERGVRMIKREDTYTCPEYIIQRTTVTYCKRPSMSAWPEWDVTPRCSARPERWLAAEALEMARRDALTFQRELRQTARQTQSAVGRSRSALLWYLP